MDSKRIQKLLFNEYSDFEEIVLLESPFTETTKDGIGIRQVQMALTTTKLILATDILKCYDVEGSSAFCLEAGRIGIDPEIESLELASLFPVEVVNLSVFRKRDRKTLKAHFCNDTVLYFELSGSEKKDMFWNLWLERIQFLSPDDDDHSISFSESSAGSTSTSTLYIVRSRLSVTEPRRAQLCCFYNHGPVVNLCNQISFKKDSKLRNSIRSNCESSGNYADTSSSEQVKHVSCRRKNLLRDNQVRSSASLYDAFLNEKLEVLKNRSRSESDINPNMCDSSSSDYESLDTFELLESAIQLWERGSTKKKRHVRRYGLAPKPHFLHGLGPWKLSKGDTYSVQMKRSVSLVNIQRQPAEKSFRFNVSKRQLTKTISCEALHVMPRENHHYCTYSKMIRPRNPVVYFWTTNYWYRPQLAPAAYSELQDHLKGLKKMLDKGDIKEKQEKRKMDEDQHMMNNVNKMVNPVGATIEKVKKFSSTNTVLHSGLELCTCHEVGDSSMPVLGENIKRQTNELEKANTKKITVNFGIKGINDRSCSSIPFPILQKILEPKQNFSIWEFHTQALAQQLTMIDRSLFLRVPLCELGALMLQGCSGNAPNISALIAFSHRISCLVATEILEEKSLQMRARIISKFIDIADFCNRWKNIHSTQSILYGLSSLPIYRLFKTWAHLRKHHTKKYRRMVELSQQFRDPRLPTSQQIFTDGAATPPFLPSISHVMVILLNKMENYPDELLKRHCSMAVSRKEETLEAFQAHQQNKIIPKSLRRIVSALWSSDSHLEDNQCARDMPEDVHRADADSHRSTSIESKVNEFIGPILERYDKSNNKLRQLERMCVSFLQWQRAVMMYDFKRNDTAIEYLLKARYHEEMENFQHSLILEPN